MRRPSQRRAHICSMRDIPLNEAPQNAERLSSLACGLVLKIHFRLIGGYTRMLQMPQRCLLLSRRV